jgi:F420-non-reducing hydrogenase small subunit
MQKAKIALYWCAGCGGCESSVLDLAEDLFVIADMAEIVFWPIAIDRKYQDLVALPDGSIALALVNGAIRTELHEEMVRLLRRKSQVLIAHGSCAHLGGVPGLGNFFPVADLLRRSFVEAPTVCNPGQALPGDASPTDARDMAPARLTGQVKTLSQVVDVDYSVPGCPPPPELTLDAIALVLEDRPAPKGAVLASSQTLCASCPRRDTIPDRWRIQGFKRLHETAWDPDTCFLAQSLICLGPATRGGCRARCIQGNMPCRGCFGPTDGVRDHGARMLSSLAAMMDAADREEMETIAATIPDLAGLMYQFSLASSLLRGIGEEGSA